MNNILVFTDWFLPGYRAGGPIRSLANLLAHLKGDFSFHIVTRNTDYQDPTPYPGIQPNKWSKKDGYSCFYIAKPSIKKLKKLISDFSSSKFIDGGIPSQEPKVGNLEHETLNIEPETLNIEHEIFNLEHATLNLELNDKNVENNSIIYINGIWSFWFSILPLLLVKRYHKGKIIVAPRGMLSRQTWSSAGWKKIPFLMAARLTGLYRGVVFHATSESEMEDIFRFIGKVTEVVVIPNLPRLNTTTFQEKRKIENELRLVSIARIAPEKNTQFMLEVLLFCTSGKIHLDLFGPVYNEKYWQECQKMIGMMPDNIIVQYHGALDPEHIDEAFSEAHFLFMPSRGENFGHTILESIQHGVPVILSDTTPWKNLTHHGIGWDLPLNRPSQFVEVINYCVQMDQQIYNHFSARTKEYLSQMQNLDVELNQYRNLFKENNEKT